MADEQARPRTRREAREAAPARPAGLARHGRLAPRRAIRGVLALVASTLAVALVASGSVAAIAGWQLQQNIAGGVDLDPDGGEPIVPPTIGAYPGGFNMLLVGSDADAATRDSVLNDVNILVHVSADQTNAVAVSIPRDLITPFPPCKREDGTMSSALSGAQINEALLYGGLGCAVTVVESITGLDIQFAGMITFSGVIKMSNAIGGVDVCVAQDIDDSYTGLHLAKGTHTLKGSQALKYLRSRHGVGNGSDLTRISSQQVYLSALLRKLKSDETLTDVGKLFSLANAATKNMELSKQLSNLDTMVAMAKALDNIDLSRITFVQYPTTYLTGAQAGRVTTNVPKAQELFAAIKADKGVKLDKAGDDEGSTADPNATKTPKPDPSGSASADPEASEQPDDSAVVGGVSGQDASQSTCSVGFGG
ncbi:LCP family protein [Homoserinibacter sp. YIM 151385]|uniref:LCP family protein n=1 Tax=Homoserinibacter sp. YIM 151385 TaxID=2985506 RepID=UPI0022F0EF64|nr:LCP family protein [Homoserinibacter sp. YIM 151385]WBU37109.1 LCP family protein [Homoserinibacter sp. YIM 151385]